MDNHTIDRERLRASVGAEQRDLNMPKFEAVGMALDECQEYSNIIAVGLVSIAQGDAIASVRFAFKAGVMVGIRYQESLQAEKALGL